MFAFVPILCNGRIAQALGTSLASFHGIHPARRQAALAPPRHRSSPITCPSPMLPHRRTPSALLPSPSSLDSATTVTTATNLLLAANPAALESLAAAFRSLNMPKWLVEWGHPVMMGVMVAFMGLPGALQGWRGRLNANRKEGLQQKQLHETIMIAFLLLAAIGGSGGTLSVAMQGEDVWTSPHASSAALVLLLLTANAVLAYSGFSLGNDGTPAARLKARTFHAYFGAVTMAFFAVHAYLGVTMLLN